MNTSDRIELSIVLMLIITVVGVLLSWAIRTLVRHPLVTGSVYIAVIVLFGICYLLAPWISRRGRG